MDVSGTPPPRTNIEDQLRELPLLPVVVMKMMTLDRNAENYFEEITQLAGHDPAFAVRLIRIANSSALATRTPITNLKSAIVRLGTSHIATLVTAMAVMKIFVPNSTEARELWLHAIQTAIAARAIATLGDDFGINPDDAYLAGLLHDIGRFILMDTAIDELLRIDEKDWSCPGQLIAAEQKICGFDHTQLGWRVCRKWELPEHVVNVVRSHHELDLSAHGAADGSLQSLIRITRLADNLSMAVLQTVQHSADRHDIDAAISARCAALLADDSRIGMADLQAVAPGILAEADQQFAMLGLPIA